MTMAAGFVCDDGVVLCADMLYSGRIKRVDQKLWYSEISGKLHKGCGYALAGAGKGPTIWSVRDHIREAKPVGRTCAHIASALEVRLADFYQRHRETLRDEALELLIAIHGSDGAALYMSENSPTLGRVSAYACIGSEGSVLASWLIQRLFKVRTTESGIGVASAVLHQIGGFDPDVGGPGTVAVVAGDKAGFKVCDERELRAQSWYVGVVLASAFQVAATGLRSEATESEVREAIEIMAKEVVNERFKMWPISRGR